MSLCHYIFESDASDLHSVLKIKDAIKQYLEKKEQYRKEITIEQP